METRTPTPKKKQTKRKLERAAMDLTDQPSPKTPKLCLQKKYGEMNNTMRNSPVLAQALFKEVPVGNRDPMPKKKQMKRKLERAAMNLTDQPSPKTPKLCLQKKYGDTNNTMRNSPALAQAFFKTLSVEGASTSDPDWANFRSSNLQPWSSEFPFGSDSPLIKVGSDSPFTKVAATVARF